VILADDGLQHYRLRRDLEILVVDGRRRFGNGRLLPAGPLREPARRAGEVGLVVVNGGRTAPGEHAMRLVARAVVPLDGGGRSALPDWAGRRVHAVAGIGDPARFFATLRAAGLDPVEHPLPDHARLTVADVTFADGLPVLMTEKDAVKCRSFGSSGLAYLEVEAEFSVPDAEAMLARVLAVARPG
jgi:tetraacyldisaccharide 4'-kinase